VTVRTNSKRLQSIKTDY